ncbi:MAG: hypothetical protein ABSF15_01695 [Candidatus Sulfotelmatobacter sp.]|jgi:UDP-glucose 4-epimerase
MTIATRKQTSFLFRRVDIADAATAHLLAIERSPTTGFGRYIVSAITPLMQDDLSDLRHNAPLVFRRRIPEYEYARRSWKMFPGIDWVYVNEPARTELGWQPRYDDSFSKD